MSLIRLLLLIFFWFLIARFILDWVMVLARGYRPTGVVALLFEAVFTVTDPPVKFLRRFIPNLRLGNFGLDISFLVLIIGVQILLRVLR